MGPDWGHKKKHRSTWDYFCDVLMVLSFAAAFWAGIRQIDVAKDAQKTGKPRHADVVGLLLAVKVCKMPLTLTTFHRNGTFYHGVLAVGNLAAVAIWAAALYYAVK